jgi:branched-chain amino acid transport system ATP-binding protein
LGDCLDILTVEGLSTGYGKLMVLKEVSLAVEAESVVAIIGHNGAGKSTLLKAVFGLLPLWDGKIAISGVRIESPSPRKSLTQGVAYLPQGGRVFGSMTVRENLEISGLSMPKVLFNQRLTTTLELFPVLQGKMGQRASFLSGGERQMLSVASVLLFGPRLLLMDEPSLGLAPQLVSESFSWISNLARSSQISVVIVEHKVKEILRVSDKVFVLRNGKVAFSGEADSLSESKLREVYL